MALDPQILRMMASMPSSWPGARNIPVRTLRKFVRDSSMAGGLLAVTLADVRDDRFDGPGGPIPVRVYTPEGSAPFPLIVYFHGGGWVVGDLDTQDRIARGLCYEGKAVVVSVDYRLAPEHPFPAAAEDALAAVRWVSAHMDALGGDPQRLALAGDSAGAMLAAATAITARDEGEPVVAAQLLFYGSANYPSELTTSAQEFAEGPFLTADDSQFYWGQYLRDPATEQHDYRASPYRAVDHSGLPAAFVCTAECDPSRDDAERYGEKLRAAGVTVEIRRYAGMPHGFVSWLGTVPAAQVAIADACGFLHRQWAEF